MTQENKNLLLKDLCARLPYGIKALNKEEIITIRAYIPDLVIDEVGISHTVEDCKPYLFPLSSMTEEQKKYIDNRWGVNEDFDFEIDPNWGRFVVDLGDAVGFVNWLIENHFDIYGLIPKDLAIDATSLNIY